MKVTSKVMENGFEAGRGTSLLRDTRLIRLLISHGRVRWADLQGVL
jgi:hypothetical protein